MVRERGIVFLRIAGLAVTRLLNAHPGVRLRVATDTYCFGGLGDAFGLLDNLCWMANAGAYRYIR